MRKRIYKTEKIPAFLLCKGDIFKPLGQRFWMQVTEEKYVPGAFIYQFEFIASGKKGSIRLESADTVLAEKVQYKPTPILAKDLSVGDTFQFIKNGFYKDVVEKEAVETRRGARIRIVYDHRDGLDEIICKPDKRFFFSRHADNKDDLPF